MTEDHLESIQAEAQSAIEAPQHYTEAIAAMAGNKEVVAVEDIVSSSGIKLLPSGTPIDARLYEKLCGHRLGGLTLEQCLSIRDGVTAETVASDLTHLIEQHDWLMQLRARSGDPQGLRQDIAGLSLPREVLFRLTVARDQRPQLYEHSLCVTAISHYLCARLKLSPLEKSRVLLAALCHDLGELYIDPAILEPQHRIDDHERRYIYVHPIIGWLIMRELPDVDQEVARAIFQHQERLDGSGYPSGRHDNAISLSARILAGADVAASIMTRFGDHLRLSTLLQLNGDRYDQRILNLLHEGVDHRPTGNVTLEKEVVEKRLIGFVNVLECWASLRATTDISQSVPGQLLSDRIVTLRTAVVRFGFDPDSLSTPLKMAEEDASIAAELNAVVEELRFQIGELAHEFDRGWESWSDELSPELLVAVEDWRNQLQTCIVDG